MHQWVRRLILAGGIGLAGTLGFAAASSACSLDGVPSLSVNGVVAQRMTTKPSRAILAHWAPFLFAGPYHPGSALRLQENLVELRRSLPAQAFGHPWRWTLGDGTTTTGTSIRHTYRHAGDFRITVWAYYRTYQTWFEFDQALIVVR